MPTLELYPSWRGSTNQEPVLFKILNIPFTNIRSRPHEPIGEPVQFDPKNWRQSPLICYIESGQPSTKADRRWDSTQMSHWGAVPHGLPFARFRTARPVRVDGF